MIKRFLSDETGAITVDWTVMTAAIVGLGVAAAAAVRTGTGNLGADIQTSLSSAGVSSLRCSNVQCIVSQNFGDGNFAGWSRAVSTTFGAWGPMLGPFGNETFTNPLTYGVSLPEGVSNGLITFDLVIADSWDGMVGHGQDRLGESMRLLVDGQLITAQHFTQLGHGNHNDLRGDRQATVQVGDATYNVFMTMREAPTESVGGWVRPDQLWSVEIQAQNAPSSFQLGFSTNLDRGHLDESFGIQNFNISGN